LNSLITQDRLFWSSGSTFKMPPLWRSGDLQRVTTN
jgi:hypothetical protein